MHKINHTHKCDTCNLHFNTRQALHVHRWKKHHILHQAHLYTTNNNTCNYCHKHFHTRNRLLQHLRKPTQQNCLENMELLFQPLTIDDMEEARREHLTTKNMPATNFITDYPLFNLIHTKPMYHCNTSKSHHNKTQRLHPT